MFTTRRDVIAIVILITLLGIFSLTVSAKGQTLPPSKPGAVSFSSPVRFGQRLLPPGSYQFHCVHKGVYHLMAVHRVFSDASGRVVTLGKPVATDYCRMAAEQKTVRVSSVSTAKDAAGIDVIREIQIQGEQVQHIFGEVLGFSRPDSL